MSEIYVHEGKSYKAVNGWATVGQLVLIKKCGEHPHINGRIAECVVDDEFDDGSISVNIPSEEYGDISFIDNYCDTYYVLEPLESEEVTVDTSQASEQVIDMLANLARRVTSLERQLADTQRNLEKFAEQTESNSEDIRTLDERTQYRALAKEMARRLSR